MTRRATILYNLAMDCYRELYKEATPSADFDMLVENAPLNEQGQKVIDFNAYEIDSEKHKEVVEKHIKRGRLYPHEKKGFRFEMILGSGPKINIQGLD